MGTSYSSQTKVALGPGSSNVSVKSRKAKDLLTGNFYKNVTYTTRGKGKARGVSGKWAK